MPVPSSPAGPLGKLLAFLGGAVLLVLGFMFSLVLLVVLAGLGLLLWGWFWWKTRSLREALRTQATRRPAGGEVIEGEAVVVEEGRPGEEAPRRLP
jgi:hypothetical protein